MKKLFASLISLQLIIVPVSLASQTVPADTQSSSTATTSTTAKTPDEQTSKQYGQAAPDAGTNAKYDSESQSSGGYDFYAKQILAISTSVIGANIIEQCSWGMKVPSIVTFMAGSLVYILSEFAGAKAQNENHNKRIEDIKLVESQLKSQGGEVQKEMIMQRYQEEVATKEYLESRNKWMMAVTAIYWTAMGLAIAEESSGIAAATAMGTTTCASVADKLSKPCGKFYAACYAMHFPACLGAMPTGWATTPANFANPAAYTISQATCASTIPYIKGCLDYTNTYHKIAYANCQPKAGIKAMLMSKAVTMAYSTGLTRNSGSPMAKYIVMLSGLLQFMVPSLQALIPASYNYPIPRSVTFAVSAALATAITAGLNQRIAIAKENIKKLDKMVAQYKSETDDDTVIEHDKPKEQNEDPSKQDAMNGEYKMKLASSFSGSNAAVKKLPETRVVSKKPASTKTCLSQNEEKVEYSEKACSNSIQVTGARFEESQNKVLESASKLSTDLAQALADGDSKKADLLASDLSSMAASIKAATQQLQDERNEKLKEQGLEPADFGKAVGEQIAVLTKELAEASNKNNIQISSAEEAEIKAGAFFVANVPGGSSLPEKNKESSGDIKLKAKPAIVVSSKTSAAETEQKGNQEYDLSQFEPPFSPSKDEDLRTTNNPYGLSDEDLRAAKANGYFEMNERMKFHKSKEEGISGLSDSSIFKQVSNRYFMNYSKFFNRKNAQIQDKSPAAQ